MQPAKRATVMCPGDLGGAVVAEVACAVVVVATALLVAVLLDVLSDWAPVITLVMLDALDVLCACAAVVRAAFVLAHVDVLCT
jgi:hypothetical protein